MTRKTEGRAIAANDARPNSKNDLTNGLKLPRPPEQTQQLSETQSVCTRCATPASTLQIFVRLVSPSAPAEVSRLCVRCSTRGGAFPRCIKRAPLITARRLVSQKRRAA